ncbi:MAG TPA: hypothetical protein VHD63_13170 [Ktedonobacteraceae bacterium]|nr:hypothetical protein [Ktedonobacteraceae bacterium]
MSELPSSDEENLREQLLLRLITPPFNPYGQQPTLFVGTLPENFPLELPFPANTRMLGTLVRNEEHVEIVALSDLAPDRVIAFYRTELTNRGWNEPEMMHHGGGFLHSGIPSPLHHLLFCQAEPGASLTIYAGSSAGEPTDIRLNVNLSREGNPCNQPGQRRHMHRRGQSMIPVILPPEGGIQRGSGGGGNDNSWYTNATLKSELDLGELLQHYNAQLQKGGWNLTGEGSNDTMSWSTWTHTDEEKEPWNAFLLIAKNPHKSGQYTLFVRTEWDQPEEKSGFSGWFNTSSGSSGSSFTVIRNPRTLL